MDEGQPGALAKGEFKGAEGRRQQSERPPEPVTEPGHRCLSDTLHRALPQIQEREWKHLESKGLTHVIKSMLVLKASNDKDKIRIALQPVALFPNVP